MVRRHEPRRNRRSASRACRCRLRRLDQPFDRRAHVRGLHGVSRPLAVPYRRCRHRRPRARRCDSERVRVHRRRRDRRDGLSSRKTGARELPVTAAEPVDIDTIGEDLPLLEGIRTTRAIRRLRPDPVAPALIRKVCEAGTFAPSGGNRQPWIFIAVTEAGRRAWIAERYRNAFAAYIAPAIQAARAPDYPPAKRRNMESAIWLAEHFAEVPVHLVVAG